MPAYYNEIDPHAAEWLRCLIAGGHIAPGDVDERSITDVQPDDLTGYAQCHFFAGIGGWSYALRLAGWPDDRPVWTGSCPCQPFSVAGAQRGAADDRHLWPAFFDLIRECRPAKVFGEQVAGVAGLAWLDHVCADLEDAGYAAGAADLCAAGIGAPHIRQRLYWVADATDIRSCATENRGRFGEKHEERGVLKFARACDAGPMADAPPGGLGIDWRAPRQAGHAALCDADGGMDDTRSAGLEGYRPDQGSFGWDGAAGSVAAPDIPDPWADLKWIACRDGKARPAQRGIFPLAHGLPAGMVRGGNRRLAPDSTAEGRVMRLRGYGNAIVPQLAAAFIRAAA